MTTTAYRGTETPQGVRSKSEEYNPRVIPIPKGITRRWDIRPRDIANRDEANLRNMNDIVLRYVVQPDGSVEREWMGRLINPSGFVTGLAEQRIMRTDAQGWNDSAYEDTRCSIFAHPLDFVGDAGSCQHTKTRSFTVQEFVPFEHRRPVYRKGEFLGFLPFKGFHIPIMEVTLEEYLVFRTEQPETWHASEHDEIPNVYTQHEPIHAAYYIHCDRHGEPVEGSEIIGWEEVPSEYVPPAPCETLEDDRGWANLELDYDDVIALVA